jgi:hypothetical protein
MTEKQFQCVYHTGQLMTQCLAMDAAKSAGQMEKMIDVLDAAAAAICYTACFSSWNPAGYNLVAVCNYSTIGVGAAEIIDTFIQKSSSVGEEISSIMGGAGSIAGGAAGLVIGKGTTLDSLKVAKTPPAGTAAPANAKGPAQANTQETKTDKHMACGSAVLMTVEGALRLANIMAQDSAKANAANMIVALNSGSPTTGTTTSTGTLATAGNTSANSGIGSGTNSADALSGSSTASPYACAANGMGTGTGQCGVPSSAMSDPDVAMLNGPLGAAAADYAAQNPDIGNQIAGNGSGSSGAAGTPDLSPLSDLAKATLESASALASGAQGGTVMEKSRGLASASKSTLDFGQMGSAAAAAPAADMSFGKATADPAAANDIWHAGTKKSIFAIASQKIAATSSRVESVGYVSKMNQILSGQSQRAPAQVGATQTQTGSKQ